MSLITEPLAEGIEVRGIYYPIHTDFKIWIRFEGVIEKLKSEPERTVTEIMKLCFKRDKAPFRLPPSLGETLTSLFEFYAGKSANKPPSGESKTGTRRIYSFEHDAEYIYAGFLQQYGIDLCDTPMHWHKFRALFSSLADDTKIGEIMGIRALNTEKLSDKKQRAHYTRLKRMYALPDNKSEQEKENELADIIMGI